MTKLTSSFIRPLLPVRPQTAHKGMFGRVLVVAGSVPMSGAGVLCASATLKAGCGLTVLATPQSVQPVVAAQMPELITWPLPQTKEGYVALFATTALAQAIEQFQPDVLVIGPGLGEAEFVIPFLEECTLPAVVDADALNQLAAHDALEKLAQRNAPVIITPHPGEAARFLKGTLLLDGATPRAVKAAELARRAGGVCVLKGANTCIACGDILLTNTTGGPSLAKAGSGDVLAGLIAGFWAQKKAEGFTLKTALEAAACGVYLHGLCGDYAAKEKTDYCVLSGELTRYLPAALRHVLDAI